MPGKQSSTRQPILLAWALKHCLGQAMTQGSIQMSSRQPPGHLPARQMRPRASTKHTLGPVWFWPWWRRLRSREPKKSPQIAHRRQHSARPCSSTPETTPTPANGEGEQRRGGGIWALVGRWAQAGALPLLGRRSPQAVKHRICADQGER